MLGEAHINLQGRSGIQFFLFYGGSLYFHFFKVLLFIFTEKTVKVTAVNYTKSWVFSEEKTINSLKLGYKQKDIFLSIQ